jgi:energy-coupling factor transport system permease protein
MGGAQRKFKINVKGISQIIVSLIVNSFEKLDKIESFVEQVKPEDLYGYRFKLSKNDGFAVVSFILLTCLVVLVEKGLGV